MNENINFLWPKFPENILGLQRGTILTANQDIYYLGEFIAKGKKITIGFDGQFVRFKNLIFSLSFLVDDILCGIWEITGLAILQDQAQAALFIANIERRSILKKTDYS